MVKGEDVVRAYELVYQKSRRAYFPRGIFYGGPRRCVFISSCWLVLGRELCEVDGLPGVRLSTSKADGYQQQVSTTPLLTRALLCATCVFLPSLSRCHWRSSCLGSAPLPAKSQTILDVPRECNHALCQANLAQFFIFLLFQVLFCLRVAASGLGHCLCGFRVIEDDLVVECVVRLS